MYYITVKCACRGSVVVVPTKGFFCVFLCLV